MSDNRTWVDTAWQQQRADELFRRRSRRARAAYCLLALLGACDRSRTGAVHAALCGPLCGYYSSDAVELAMVGCATEARLRVYAADSGAPAATGAPPLAERCVDLREKGTRVADLFAPPGRLVGPGPLTLDGVAPRKVVVEVALYEPGGARCPGDAPFVALGRSSIVDLRGGDLDIAVPLGCRSTCQARDGLRLQARRLEDNVPLLRLPSGRSLGEIYPYQSMISPDGTCTAATADLPRGQFRPFAAEATADGFRGAYSVDSAGNGCTAVRIDGGSDGVTFACLQASLASATMWVVGDARLLARLHNLAGSAPNGALVLRIYDRAGRAAVGARVTWQGTPLDDAQYLQDDWKTFAPGGALTTTGIVVVRDAPTAAYAVIYPTDPQTNYSDSVSFSAGAADVPGSITTLSVIPPPL